MDLFKNWIRGVLGLKYLKLGLEEPAEQAVKRHHAQIVQGLPEHLLEETCTKCQTEFLQPMHSKKQCPRIQNKNKCLCSLNPHTRRQCSSNGLCSVIYDMIASDHRFEDPAMRNTRMGQWKTDAWSVAACYMSNTELTHTSGCSYKISSKQLDCAELLMLFINNKAYLQDTSYGVFDMARIHRNKLFHNPNYEINNEELDEYLKDFRAVLEVTNDSKKKVFGHYAEVKQSLKALKDLHHKDIDISTKEELEKMKNDMRNVAMDEEADKLDVAISKKNDEITQMQSKIKSTEKEEEQSLQFVQHLSDTILRAGESRALVCELNKDNCHVFWSKNGKPLTKSKHIYPLADKGRHCLVFSKAMPEDSGMYKCTYKDMSTSASLIISNHRQTVENRCEKHDGTEVSWFCKKHLKLICKTCLEKKHRQCSGLMELKEIDKEQTREQLAIEYICTYEQEGNEVICICALPHGEFLVLFRRESNTDKHNYILCKFNSEYVPVPDYVVIQDCQLSMCYIGNNKVVRTNGRNLFFINVTSLHHEKYVECQAQCLACHGNIIYAIHDTVVHTYTTDGAKVGLLCTLPASETDSFMDYSRRPYSVVAVSNDGNFIFCIAHGRQIYKIDSRNGFTLFTFNLSELYLSKGKIRRICAVSSVLEECTLIDSNELILGQPLCMQYIGCGTVIICDDKGNVFEVNDKGEFVVSKLILKEKSFAVFSACYDTVTSSLFVGDKNGFNVFKVQYI